MSKITLSKGTLMMSTVLTASDTDDRKDTLIGQFAPRYSLAAWNCWICVNSVG